MSVKDFEQGMVVGAKPFEEVYKKQEAAIRRVSDELGRKVNNFHSVMDVLIDDMNGIKRKELYDLNAAPIDLNSFEQEEKEFVVSGLYTLASMCKNHQTSPLQKEFIRSIQGYLGIMNPQQTIDVSKIASIDSGSKQKAIMQVFMEYLFLEKEDFTFLTEYADFFAYFSVNDNDREAILQAIHNVYKAIDSLGFIEKYGFVLEIEDITEPNMPFELEELTIDTVFHVPAKEEKIISAKKIRLNVDIHLEGKLMFENCVITYNGDNIKGRIRMEKDTSLTLSHCTIIGINDEKRTENPEKYLITGCDKTSKLLIDNCLFYNCLSFAYNTGVQLTNSIVRYAKLPLCKPSLFTCDTFNNSGADSRVENCLFESMETEKEMMSRIVANHEHGFPLEYFYPDLNDCCKGSEDEKKEKMIKYFNVSSPEEAQQAYDNAKEEIKKHYAMNSDFRFTCLLTGIKNITGCSFKNLRACFFQTDLITQCQFVNCIHIIDATRCKMTNCSFVNCSYIIDVTHLDISYCHFSDCYDRIIKTDCDSSILYCQFCRIYDGKILFEGIYNQGRNKISHCLFDGIFIPRLYGFLNLEKKNSLILAEIPKYKGIVAEIVDCEFRHCNTGGNESNIIETSSYYQKGLLKKDVWDTTISVHNCPTLENVNKEGELTDEVTIQQETATGKPIGSRLDETLVGVPGYTQDFTFAG